MDEYGASPLLTPSPDENENPFNDGNLLTPATAVVQDPFEKSGALNIATPKVEVLDPLARE
jgi:hypothetical protein